MKTYIKSTVVWVFERKDIDWPVCVVPATENGNEADGRTGKPNDDNGDKESSLANVRPVAKGSCDGPKANKK